MTAGGNERGAAPRRWRMAAAAAVAALTAMALAVAPAAAGNKINQRADVMNQGGDGVARHNGAKLERRVHSIEVEFKMPTPAPGSYLYPTPDLIPPGAPPHPELVPGYPEVFSLWAFVFNHPENCTDPCNIDDIGDTPAMGGVFQLDATIAYGSKVDMGGTVWVSELAALGVPLSNPLGAEVHIAGAPHGMALEGADLTRQLNGAVGGPPHWFPALFFAP